jgi:hypothetical protein
MSGGITVFQKVLPIFARVVYLLFCLEAYFWGATISSAWVVSAFSFFLLLARYAQSGTLSVSFSFVRSPLMTRMITTDMFYDGMYNT